MIKKLYYKVAWYSYCAWIEFLYCEWNPWALARLNLAWTNYTKTSMYSERKKIDYMGPKKFKEKVYEDYAEQAYVENLEIKLFTSLFTWKDRARMVLAPYSCGDKHTMPWLLIKNRLVIMLAWVIGAETEEK